MITPMKQIDYIIGINDQNRRLDRILKKAFPLRSPGDLYKALRKGLILVNGKKAGAETRLTEGDRLTFKGILAEELSIETGSSFPVCSPPQTLPVVWENGDLICLNKPRGQLVHGPDSLEVQVRAYLAAQIEESLSFTPGPLHRLDRNTTGLIMFSRSLRGAQVFTEKLRNRRLVKLYLAVLEGLLTEPQLWEDPLLRREGVTTRDPREGSPAKTELSPLLSDSHLSLAIIRIHTGKPHQIRAQAAHHGFPLAGDIKYGGSPKPGGFRLHAWRLLDSEAPPLFPPLTAAPPSGFFDLFRDGLTPRERETVLNGKLSAVAAEGFLFPPLGKGFSGE